MLFSIVIPVFNGRSHIKKALISILQQEYQDYEVIIVNDGSTDDTKLVVDEWIAWSGSDKFQLVNISNQGRSAARNYGIDKARGDYICFLDADDYYHSNHLSEFKSAIKKYPRASFYFANSEIKNDEGGWSKYEDFLSRFLERGDFWIKNDIYIEFGKNASLFLCEGSLIPMCSTAISKEVFAKIGGFNLQFDISEDLELWLRIFESFEVIAINKKLSVVIHHANNSSHPKNKALNIAQQIKVSKYMSGLYSSSSPALSAKLDAKQAKLYPELMYHASESSLRIVCECALEFMDLTVRRPFMVIKYIVRSIFSSS